MQEVRVAGDRRQGRLGRDEPDGDAGERRVARRAREERREIDRFEGARTGAGEGQEVVDDARQLFRLAPRFGDLLARRGRQIPPRRQGEIALDRGQTVAQLMRHSGRELAELGETGGEALFRLAPRQIGDIREEDEKSGAAAAQRLQASGRARRVRPARSIATEARGIERPSAIAAATTAASAGCAASAAAAVRRSRLSRRPGIAAQELDRRRVGGQEATLTAEHEEATLELRSQRALDGRELVLGIAAAPRSAPRSAASARSKVASRTSTSSSEPRAKALPPGDGVGSADGAGFLEQRLIGPHQRAQEEDREERDGEREAEDDRRENAQAPLLREERRLGDLEAQEEALALARERHEGAYPLPPPARRDRRGSRAPRPAARRR